MFPADDTKRGQKRILDHFAYFIMNVEAGVNYHGFDNSKPIELKLKLDPVGKELLIQRNMRYIISAGCHFLQNSRI